MTLIVSPILRNVPNVEPSCQKESSAGEKSEEDAKSAEATRAEFASKVSCNYSMSRVQWQQAYGYIYADISRGRNR